MGFFYFFIICLMLITGQAFAADPPVAQEMRAAEIIRIAEEKSDWLDGRRIFYFDQMHLADRLESKAKEELSRAITPSQGQFLNLQEVRALCTAVRRISRDYFPQAREILCDIQDRILDVSIKP